MDEKKNWLFVLCMGILLCRGLASAQSAPIDTTLASQYFQAAQTASTQDNGKLWGISLYGPMLFVDPQTRTVVANQSDLRGFLTPKDGVFVGNLPETQPIANAVTTWGGVKWTMIVWSFMTNDNFQRVKLMLHESFHRVQSDLQLPAAGLINNHLDTLEGRFWLQLEWRALRKALSSEGTERRKAIGDALLFRNYRRSLFPRAEAAERALEMHEGLAEYTGFKLSAQSDAQLIEYLVRQIDKAPERSTFVGSFAYASGPAYGVLLDAYGLKWRKGLTPREDLGERLQKPLGIKLSPDLKASAEKQALHYGGDTLRAAEVEREAKRQKQIADYRLQFVDGPNLLITLTDRRSVTINSTNMVPIEKVGTVYPTARVSDAWGILEVSKGALMVSTEGGRITQVIVSAPTDLNGQPVKGYGWTLQLNSGWKVTPGSRQGDFILQKVEP